jgi:alpha-beta hydrolase superfamily lysophospholipase
LADHDFEVFAIDWRGFGESEGLRSVIESAEDLYNDHWLLVHEVCKQFKVNQHTTPMVLMGRSMGGLIAT